MAVKQDFFPSSHPDIIPGTPSVRTAWGGKYECASPVPHPVYYEQFVRCRKCWPCQKQKRAMWVARMHAENRMCPRSWFVTLTYRNVKYYGYPEVQKWLKRVRKTTGYRFKYICTTEFESSGERDYHPHHHLIIYGPIDLQKRHLRSEWDQGTTHARLTDSPDIRDVNGRPIGDPFWYVAKYVIKGTERVRASSGLGNPEPEPPGTIRFPGAVLTRPMYLAEKPPF